MNILRKIPTWSRPTFAQLNANEKRWLGIVIALHLLAITLPYLWAWSITPPGMHYGGLLWTVEDHNVHLAWARQAYEGHFFIRDLFTNETITLGERPLFNNLFTFILGTWARWTHLPLIVVYHGLRVVFAALALYAFYLLCARVTNDRRIRLTALLFAAFSTGAGWLQLFFPAWSGRVSPIDRPDLKFMMPEAFTFTSNFVFAIFAVSIFLLVVIYVGVLRSQEDEDWRPALIAALAAFLLANIHTYDALPLNVILLVWGVTCWRRTKRSIDWLAPVLVAVASWPPVLYQIVVFLNSTEFRLKALMRTSPPPLWDILLSYGLLIPLACWGAWQWRQRRSTLLLVLWAAVPIAMSYLPLSFGRKMMEGVHLPLCILAAAGLVALAAKLKTPALRRFAVAVVLLVGSISSVYFVGWCLKAVEENNWPRVQGYSMAPFYLTQSDVAALEFLRERPQAEKTVTLSLLMLGNYVPRITGGVAFGGHPAETLHYYDIKTGQGKFTDIKRFFGQRSRMSPAEARRWLRDNRISVIIYGEYEQRFGVTLPFALPVIKEFPGTNDLPGTILFDASAVWPQ